MSSCLRPAITYNLGLWRRARSRAPTLIPVRRSAVPSFVTGSKYDAGRVRGEGTPIAGVGSSSAQCWRSRRRGKPRLLSDVLRRACEPDPRRYRGAVRQARHFGIEVRSALVKPGRVPDQFGRWLNRALELRSTGDYGDVPPDQREAQEAIARAEAFLEAIEKLLASSPPLKPRGRRA